jgi:glutamate carboxypeptidase
VRVENTRRQEDILVTDSDKAIDLLRKLVETESPSHNKSAVDNVGEIVLDECLSLSADIETISHISVGNHLIARWGKGPAGILLLHHMDTVFPLETLKKMPFYQKEDKTYGPGVLDMKGGIVITLSAIRRLQEEQRMPAQPVTALFTSDEEIGSDSSRALIEKLARESSLVLVLESGLVDGALKVWRKGVGEFQVKVQGRAAHAGGAHEDGRNAIEEMAHQVLAIQNMTDYSKGTTLNVGVIKGGTASNVVPAVCEIDVDYRVLVPDEAERINTAMNSLQPVTPGTSITVTGGLNRPPMPTDDLMERTFEKASQIASGIGMILKAGGTGGGSDANFVAPLGIPVLDGLGTFGEGYHSEREYIFTDSLFSRTALVAELINRW